MSVTKIDIINTCESVVLAISPLEDLEFQKKFWFDDDGPVISTFEEATENFERLYEIRSTKPNFQKLCNLECQNFIKELYGKVSKYKWNVDRIEKYGSEIALLEDPVWLDMSN